LRQQSPTQLEAKAQRAKEKRERGVEIRAREFTEFEQEIKAHKEMADAVEEGEFSSAVGLAAEEGEIDELPIRTITE
jgi:hypothetical protein